MNATVRFSTTFWRLKVLSVVSSSCQLFNLPGSLLLILPKPYFNLDRPFFVIMPKRKAAVSKQAKEQTPEEEVVVKKSRSNKKNDPKEEPIEETSTQAATKTQRNVKKQAPAEEKPAATGRGRSKKTAKAAVESEDESEPAVGKDPAEEDVESKKPEPKGKGRAKKVAKVVAESEEIESSQNENKAAKSEETAETNDDDEDKDKPERKNRGRAKKIAKATAEVEPSKTDEVANGDGDDVKSEPKGRARGARKAAVAENSKKKDLLNPTKTTYDNIDFSSNKQSSSGETPNFRICSWNVDGIRSWLDKGGMQYLEFEKPDIFCIQETKCSEDQLPEQIVNLEGYHKYWISSTKKGYAGAGILTREVPLNVEYGIKDAEQDEDGRCITAEFEKFYVISVYVPNAGAKLVTLPKRLLWNKSFKAYIKELEQKKPVIICGDMNVAHNEIDLANPKTNTKNAGFTKEEREGMTDFLQEGYIDSFRKIYPDTTDAYTFWSYRTKARAKNVGWRLDYFLVSNRLQENICDSVLRSDILGSDHCPIALLLNI